MAKTKGLVEDAVIFIPRSQIHPDPDQPRVKVDDELQASIDSEGIIQAITVRPHPTLADEWMIVDGERRWQGGAHLKTIPCRIRLDLEDSVDRLITQLAANTGKPLTAIEQARAFKRALDADPKLSQAKLAERLGVPRSTIGDRIRLIELHSAWMKLIESGRLQVSHAPLIHQYRAVPDEYQVKAAKKVADGDGWQIAKYQKGDVIPISAFRDILRDAFKDYVIKLEEVRSYKGPVLEIEEEIWSFGPEPKKLRKVKYAADITLWRPIKREADKRARQRREATGHSSSSYRYVSPFEKAMQSLKAAGLEIPERKVGSQRAEPGEGEAVVFADNGWPRGIHPKVLLEKLDPSSLIRLKGQYGGDQLLTTDLAAVEAAREAFRKHEEETVKKDLAPLRAKLTPAVLEKHAVRGPGTPALLLAIGTDRDAKVVALALGIEINGDVDDDGPADDDDAIIANDSLSDAEKLLSALATVTALGLEVPNSWQLSDKVNRGISNVPFKLEKSKSKKQQKREARAAGKQVGDPSRANRDNIAAGEAQLAEEDLVDEPELVEA